ncbi:YceI family protein [Fulvimarina sp. 2208YS6-2-32]|uniref:YceI family protein n=1 Tax=Fulvimarina uroteuthidis TaxID=3098149 RepID=A0ABU5I0K3_9HYPH|nr:YceI family protein [Fulvimarina sp. 2208YS6-2-32]MDY8108929.1 YceI family protein [Fulvimarina sp. 2208YS6-2-32]
MRHLLLSATTAVLIATGAASAQSIDVPAGTYVTDPNHTNVLWKVDHFGLSTYIGRFDTMSATLELDPENVAESTLTATVDPTSVSTNFEGDKSFDEEISGEQFLNAPEFPEAKFVSKSIEITGDNTGKVTGDLTLHGQTHEEVMDVTFNTALNPHPMTQNPAVGFGGMMTIDRTKYGIDYLAGPVSKDVTLEIQAEFVPQS